MKRGVYALGLLALACAMPLAAEDAPAPVVEVAQVTTAALAPQVRAPGTVISIADAEIAAELDGRLVMVAEVGQRLKKGDPVAKIDDELWLLQRETDQATIRRLQANLDYLQRQQERLVSLASKNNMAQAELDEQRSRREMVAQELAAARVQLARTELHISRAHVLAPFDGVVAERLLVPGEYTEAGEALARLVDTTRLEVTARAPIAVTRFNREGSTIEVSGGFGTAQLPIRSLVPVGDLQSRLVEVRLEVTASDWVIGEPVEVQLANGPRAESVAVPRDALLLRKEGVFVFRVDEAKVAHRIEVVAGDGDGQLVPVRGELSPADCVVVIGAERLRDGQTVNIREQRVATR